MERQLTDKMMDAIWHDISERPIFGRKLLILDLHEHCHSVTPTERGWDLIILGTGVNKKWAYQDALVPHIAEETK